MTTPASPDTEAADREAMNRLVQGDEHALAELAERYAPRVVRLLARLIGDEQDALDLCQETFLRVYRARADYDPARPFHLWLFTIAANLGRNVVRARRRFLRISLDESAHDPDAPSLGDILAAEAPPPDQVTEKAELRFAVRQAIEKLPVDMRSAVVLVDLEDLSVKEAAAILQVPARTIESRLYHARRRLRDRLARWLNRLSPPTTAAAA